MACKKTKPKKLKICRSAFNKTVVIQDRAIQNPGQNSVDYSMKLTDTLTVRAMVETVSGVTQFDGTNTERDITHRITVDYKANAVISAENYARIGQTELDIVTVENVNEDNKYLRLRCALRGSNALPSNF